MTTKVCPSKTVPNNQILFAEDSDPYHPYAQYHEKDWMVSVKYTDDAPIRYKETTPCASREDLCEQIVADRITKVHNSNYPGFEVGAWGKLTGCFRRIFSFSKSHTPYHQHLLGKSVNLRHPNYSMKPVKNFFTAVTPKNQLKKSLGLKDPKDNCKLWFTTTWKKNGLNGYRFIDESGQNVIVHDAVTSSNDRTSEKIGMMRAVDDYLHTQESIAYTGRPDTREKALEQIEFMFEREFKKTTHQKGIRKDDNGVFEFTYLVNNLMSPIKAIGLITFDELESIQNEKKVLEDLSQETLTICGKKVRIKPMYFNQMFNQCLYYSELGFGTSQNACNKQGYEALLTLAKGSKIPQKDQSLLDSAITYLENPAHLLPQEELFYRDLIAKLLKLPVVFHCKSSTDRTTIALAISIGIQQWRNTDQTFNGFQGEAPHSILSSEIFKKLFLANTMHGHQVTRVSRTAQGKIKDHHFNSRQIGLEWKNNPVVLDLLPKKYTLDSPQPMIGRSVLTALFGKNCVQPSFQPFFIGFIKVLKCFFYGILGIVSDYFYKKYDYYEKVYPNKQINMNHPFFESCRLFKASGMKV